MFKLIKNIFSHIDECTKKIKKNNNTIIKK